jgi:flagellar assembly factor FliW
MPFVDTKLFGRLPYDDDQVIHLRTGLPGLPHTDKLLPVSQASIEPFVFFQSIHDPNLSLLAVPLAVAKKDFQLHLSAEARVEIGLEANEAENDHGSLGAFALVSVAENHVPTANLLAPLVICFPSNLAVQAIQPLEPSYLRYPIAEPAVGGDAC